MHSYESLQSERMSSDEAQRVAQLLSERLRDSIGIEEFAATMNVPRDQVVAALSQVRMHPSVTPTPGTRIDKRLLITAVFGVVVVWTLFLASFMMTRAEVQTSVQPPVPGQPTEWAVPTGSAEPDTAPEVARDFPAAPAPEAPSANR